MGTSTGLRAFGRSGCKASAVTIPANATPLFMTCSRTTRRRIPPVSIITAADIERHLMTDFELTSIVSPYYFAMNQL
ncbi:hypothetical protein INT44_006694 [Umbelopsis vinacea]|uniref:Uncharacterized protein n=1 Tax=Umbelopsis vinacea TaxID=44442 RepID=A0A8H7PDY6_9FUNG|nr:hypothetical protein INT44_006694 [Umbelopsis vinacea]